MIIKSNENVIERKYMLGFFDSRHFQTDQINTIIPLPFKYVPPFKTFDDRLDFVHYIHFAIDKIPGQKPDVFDLSTRGVLTWYKKYQAAIFAAIVCKADHLPRLNKDVIFAISEFIS